MEAGIGSAEELTERVRLVDRLASVIVVRDAWQLNLPGYFRTRKGKLDFGEKVVALGESYQSAVRVLNKIYGLSLDPQRADQAAQVE